MKTVTYNGVDTPVSQVAIECKVHITVMYQRIRKGLTQETGLFNKGRLPRRCVTCVLDGKEVTIVEAAEIVGLSITTIRIRLKEGLTQRTGLFGNRPQTITSLATKDTDRILKVPKKRAQMQYAIDDEDVW